MAETHSLGISPEEFEQYQRQFIEERSEKYALLEKVRKLEQDLAKIALEKSAEKDFDKLIKDKFQKPFQTLLSRTKRESISESAELMVQQENDALQKRLHSQEDDFQRQNVLLMQELQRLAVTNEELERQLKSSTLYSSPLETGGPPGALRDALEGKIRSLEAELSAFRTLSASSDGEGTSDQPKSSSDRDRSGIELAAATEEIRMLKDEMESNRKVYEAAIADQEKMAANLIRDLESKQLSVQLLLSEKDHLKRLNKDLVSSSAVEREKLLFAWKEERVKTAEENHQLRQAVEDERVMSRTRADDLERQMKDLLEQIDVSSRQTKEDNEELLNEHKTQIKSLLEKMEEVAKLSEKRRATIEDLSFHLASLKEEHEEEKEKIKEEGRGVAEQFNLQLIKAKTETENVSFLEKELKELKDELHKTLQEKEGLSAQLTEQSSITATLHSSHALELTTLRHALTTVQSDFFIERSELTREMNEMNEKNEKKNEEFSEKISILEENLKDKNEEMKIIERKNTFSSRHLQKQLQMEKRHVEKLQNKLNEVLKDNSLKLKLFHETLNEKGKEEREEGEEGEEREEGEETGSVSREETGSVSSWSFVSSKTTKMTKMKQKTAAFLDAQSNQSNTETEMGVASAMTEAEVHDLVTRITKLQQEKAGLVERVSMLETGNAAMAQDLLNKSAVIDRYLQNTPVLGHHGQLSGKEAEAFSLKSLIDRLGRDKTMDVEMQKNLRLLLEETLTKNVHLQKNMELLTEELDRLRGSTPPRN